MSSPKQLRNTIKATQNIRTLLNILVTSKNSYKVNKDRLYIVNTQFSYSVNSLLMLYMTREGGTSQSPTCWAHRSHFILTQPCSSGGTASFTGGGKWTQAFWLHSIIHRNITSHLYFFKALTFKTIRISDSQPRQSSESTTFTHTFRQCYNNDDDDDAAIY